MIDIEDLSTREDFVDKSYHDQNSGLGGSQVRDTSVIFRLVMYVAAGSAALVIILSWRSSLFDSTQYQSMPVSHEQVKIKNENEAMEKSLQEKMLGGEAEDLDQ